MLERLKPFIHTEYKTFNEKIIPSSKPILGVYTKDLKKIAKEMVSQKEFSFLYQFHTYFEEDMIHIYMLTYLNDFSYLYPLLQQTIPLIDNWAMCDQLVCNLHIVQKYKKEFLKLIEEYRHSNREFEIRFVLIMLLRYYCEEEYKDYIFDIIGTVKKDAFYVKMGIAWLLCECAISMKEETFLFIKNCFLEEEIINKTIQKIKESRKISPLEKQRYCMMKNERKKYDTVG